MPYAGSGTEARPMEQRLSAHFLQTWSRRLYAMQAESRDGADRNGDTGVFIEQRPIHRVLIEQRPISLIEQRPIRHLSLNRAEAYQLHAVLRLY